MSADPFRVESAKGQPAPNTVATIARTLGADLDRDVAARRARDLIRDRVNDMRREEGR